MTRRKKKGMPPLLAFGMLAVGVGFVGWRLLPGSPAGGGDSSQPIVTDPDMGEGEAVASVVAAATDLNEKFGSWSSNPVRLAFSILAEAAPPAAAPAGEVSRPVSWDGDDPPSLRLGVVMLSPGAQRAVLDGRVVGRGDVVKGAVVTDIRNGTVVVRWRARTLTYDLEDANPREFRAEAARRSKLQAERAEDGATGTTSDTHKQEKGS